MQYFENFEPAFRYVENHPVALINSPFLSGEIQKIEIEEDLFLYNLNAITRKKHTFHFQIPDLSQDQRVLSCHFNPTFNHLQIGKIKYSKKNPSESCFTFTKGNLPIELTYNKNSSITGILVLFHQRWLYKQLKMVAGKNPLKIKELKELPQNYFGQLSKLQTTIARKLNEDFNKNESLLTFKSDLYKFLSQFETEYNNQNTETGELDAIIQDIEEQILSSLKSKMPKIDELALQHFISSSSLKRHFKEIYGKSIYGYYLEHKMALAKQMIRQQPISISQIATDLGYESLSHFSKFFSKYFGTNPAEFRKRNSLLT